MRNVLLGMVAMGWFVASAATPTLTGRTDRDPLSYRTGEEMVFTLTADGGKAVRWTRTGDDGRMEKGEAGADAPVVVKTSLDRAGFVRLVAELLDASGKTVARFDGGAGAEVDAILPDNPEPNDFDAFWARHRATLAKVPMVGVTCREVASGRADVKLYEVSIPCAGPRPSTGFLSIPAKPGKYPAHIHFHGYNGSWMLHARTTPKPDTLHADSLNLYLSAHGYAFNRDETYYKNLRASCGSNGHDYAFDPIQNADPEQAYFCGMTYRVMRGLEYLKSRPEWDGKTLVAEGGSQGGLQSIWAAALDHDVTECRPFIPWNCNMGGPAVGRAHGDWHIPWVAGLGYYDAANMARRIPATCRVTVTWAGLGDYVCPPSGVMAFYNRLTCPKSITFIQGATHFTHPPKPWQTASRSAAAVSVPQIPESVRLEWHAGGERPSVVLDFGPDCVGGYPAFVAVETKGDPVVRASYATHPDGIGDKGDFWYETRATYLGPAVDLPILPASVNRYDIFAVTNTGRYDSPLAQGLVRYVRLTLDKPGAAVTINGFTLENRGVYATEPMVGSFDCSDARLNAIWRMSVRTCELSAIPARTEPLHVVSTLKPACDVWLGPSHAYLADGAKRDRLVWSGDLWWAQRNMYAAYGYDSPYMLGSLKMLAENSTPEGYVQACPYPESHGPLKDGDYGPFASDEFAAWFVPVAWDHILHSGDRALAKELYPKVRALVAYLRAHCREDGIFKQRRETSKHASSLDFGEASTYHRSYMNILLWKTYIDAACLADWLGDGESAAAWRTAAEQLAASVRRVFWDAGKGRFRGAIEADRYQGEANGLALAVKFCTADEAAAVRKTFVRHQHGKFQALFVRGLYAYGYADDAVARIYEHGWDDVLDPAWKGPRLTSECMHLHHKGWGDEAHPDTAIAGILTNSILGVEPTEPGYAKYLVNPHPSKGVTQASGVVPTPWGELHVSWRLEGGRPVVDCREVRKRR